MTDGKEIVATALKSAKPAKRSDKPKDQPAARAGKDVPYDTSFPADCPVEPLGINGDDVFFLDQRRQLRVIKAEKLNQGTIRSLFCEQGDLKYSYWPRYSKPNEAGEFKIIGWRPEQAADALLNEASRRGIWDVLDRVRGPGCWQDEDGNLIMHCGDLLYHGEETLTPRAIGRHVYPAAPAKPHPIGKGNQAAGIKEANELLALFKTWSWRRPDVDPYLLLGWICDAILGGALRWRPALWITGDKATGKSTLQEVIKGVLGPGGLIPSTDASAASLWQTVGHASLPVALDELEAEEDNRRQANIIKLARAASSGGQLLRGGSDHKSSSFTVRSCFLFSSILIPPMLGQDISRMAVLQLDKLDGRAPHLEPRRLAEIGAALRGRILREWKRMPALIETFKAQLAAVGHSGRGGDQFGTLLAGYELLTADYEPDAEALEKWGKLLDKATLAESEGDISDQERCIGFLLTTQLDLFRSGERRTVGSWVVQAAGRDKEASGDIKIEDANRALGNVGMKVIQKQIEGKKQPFLLVANDHQGLAALFRESHWRSASGTNGVWVQALRRIAGSYADQQRFNGVKVRCTAIPLNQILEDQGGGGHA